MEVYDKQNNLTCYMINGDNSSEIINKLRSLVKETYQKLGYVGFSDNFDKSFDKNSFYFFVQNENNDIKAIQRLIIKKHNTKLPLEMACINSVSSNHNLHYTINELNVAEITSSIFSSAKAFKLSYICMSFLGTKMNINKAYALLDVNMLSLRKLYEKIGWVKSQEFYEPIYFPDYGKIVNGKFIPTQWEIMELTESKISNISNQINNYSIKSN